MATEKVEQVLKLLYKHVKQVENLLYLFFERNFMSDQVNPIPAGYHTVTPYLIIQDAAKAIDFYQQAFGAVELFRMADPSTGRP